MSKRKSIFGPSKDEIWEQIATNIGGDFILFIGFIIKTNNRKNLTFISTSCKVYLEATR